MNFSMLQDEYPLINLTKSDFEVDKLSDENELFMPSCFTGGKKWISCSNSNKKPQHFNNCNAVDHDKVCREKYFAKYDSLICCREISVPKDSRLNIIFSLLLTSWQDDEKILSENVKFQVSGPCSDGVRNNFGFCADIV